MSGHNRSPFAALMCSVGSNVCAGGAAEADDGESNDDESTADISITVNEMGGRKFELCLPGSSYVSTVKLRLERAGAAPVKQQDLFVGGAEDKCRDDAVVSQLLPDKGVPRVLFLLVRPADPVAPVSQIRKQAPYDMLIKLLMIGDGCKSDAARKRDHLTAVCRSGLWALGSGILIQCYCSGVGKTCLLHTYKHNRFAHTFITIGIDFMVSTIELGGKRIKLQVSWTDLISARAHMDQRADNERSVVVWLCRLRTTTPLRNQV